MILITFPLTFRPLLIDNHNLILIGSFNTIQTCTVYPLALTGGGLHATHAHTGHSGGLSDPLLKGTHLAGAVAPHHLQQIHDVSVLFRIYRSININN